MVKLLGEQKQPIVNRAVTRGLDPHVRLKRSGIDWLGDIPEHWEIKRGKELFRCIDVRSTTGAEELLTVSSDRGVVPRSSATVTMFKAESYVGHKLCWPGDLVINSLWAWGGGLGVSRYHGIVSSAYGIYRLREKYSGYAAYIHELVRSAAFNWELQVRSKGIWRSRLQLTDDAFLAAPFPVPPFDEQKEIADFLSQECLASERAIRHAENQAQLLHELRTRLIADVVTGKLDVCAAAARLPQEAIEDEESLGDSDPPDDAFEGGDDDASQESVADD